MPEVKLHEGMYQIKELNQLKVRFKLLLSFFFLNMILKSLPSCAFLYSEQLPTA